MRLSVTIRGGSVYLPAAMVETYFPGVDAVVLLIRDDALHVMPVARMEQGGCLLKRRNAAGDRVAAAPDIFHAHGLQEWAEAGCPARWSSQHAALVIALPANKVSNGERT